MIYANSGCAHVSAQSRVADGRLLKMGAACREFSVSPSQLRSWVRSGQVAASRVGPQGKYRIVRSSLEQHLGLDVIGVENQENTMNGGGVGVYARRSSPGKVDREGLDRQVSDLVAYATREFGTKKDAVCVYREQVSGMSIDLRTRTALNQVYEDAKAGKIRTLVVRDKSRLARIPGGEALLVKILGDLGVKVIYVADFVECEEENKEDITMLLNFMTVITNRQSSKKAAYNRTILLSQETQDFVTSNYANGVSVKALVRLCAENSIRGTKHNGETVAITEKIVLRTIHQNQKLVVLSGEKREKGPLDKWFAEKLTKSKAGVVRSADLQTSYATWSAANGFPNVSSKSLGTFLKGKGLISRKIGKAAVRHWHGISLLP